MDSGPFIPSALPCRSNTASCPLEELQHRSKAIKCKYHQSRAGDKILAPPAGSPSLPRWVRGPLSVPCLPLYPCAQDLSLVPQRQTLHPAGKCSGVTAALDPLPVLEISSTATCPVAPGTPPDWEGLWCHHVYHGSRPAPSARGIWHHHVRSGSPPDREGLHCRHVSDGSRPASRCRRVVASPRATGPAARQGRASVLPRVPRLQTRLPV
jgi:hypothetical protein